MADVYPLPRAHGWGNSLGNVYVPMPFVGESSSRTPRIHGSMRSLISGSQQTLLNEKFLESPSPNGGTTINGNELSSRSASRGHQQYQREEDIYLSPVGYKVSYQFENSDKTRPLHVAVPDRPNRSDSLRYSDLIDKVKLIDKYRSQSLPRLDNSQRYRSKSLPRLETGDMNGNGSRYERKGSAGQSDINGNVFKPIYVPKGDENMRVNLTKRDSVPRSRGRPKDRVARRRQSQSLPRRKNSNPDLQSLPGKNDFHYKSLPQLSGDRPGSSSGRYVTSESLNSMEKASRSNTMPNLHSASHLLSKTNLDYFSREELLTSLDGYQPHSIPNIEKNHGSTAITKLGQSSQSKSPRNRPYNIGNEAVGYDKPSSHQYPRSFSDSDVKRMDGGFLVDETFGMSSFTNGEIRTAPSRDDSFGMERLNQPKQQGIRPFIGGSSPEDRDVTGDDVSLPQYYRQRPRIQDYFPAMPVDYSVRSAMNDNLNMPLGIGGSYHRPPAYQRQWSDITPTAEYMRELGYVVTTGRKPWSAWHARSSSIPGSSNRPMCDLRLLDRGMGAIPPLIDLINSDNPEVQRNACGVLKNLSFGKGDTGLRNKKQIVDAGGITALIRLLRRAQDEEVKELATGILWNLSSSEELKGKIIAEGLPEIVSRVIVPYSGWEQRGLMQNYEPWTTVYKNATGIIRNLSSANKDDEAKGYDTRNKLRECSKLVNCLVYTLKISQANKDRESKPVENCTCALRNLSFRIQEVVEQDFYKKRTLTLKKRQQPEKKDSPGCFGGGGKKKDQKAKGKPDLNQNAEVQLPPGAQEFQALWQPEAVSLYIDILKESSNPVTVEAAAGAIQNLTACYWKYADEIRSLVRKEKGLPALVDLLGQDRDSVVCHSALALRNLAIDEKNKELIGKYAMKQITFTLPMEKQKESVPDRTVCAVVALLHEVVKNSVDFAQLFTAEGGIVRLKFVKFSRGKFLNRTKEHTQTLLNALWEFKTLHGEYAQYGMTEQDFKREPAPGRSPDAVSPNSNFNTPYSTMSRPMESQGYDDNTLSPGRPMNKPYQPVNGRMDGYHGNMVQGHSNPAMNMEEPHGYDDRRRGEDIPMSDIAPGYAPLEERRDRRPPVGGVPLFPALQPQGGPGEPLYAQVNKNKRKDDMGPPSPNHVMLGDPNSPQGGADSWV